MHNFKTKSEIYEYIQSIDPIRYEQTRNNLKGSVTMLSPYITAGVITLNEIKYMVLAKNKLSNCYKLIQELAWRDFFQSVYLSKKYEIFEDLKNKQIGVISNDMPKAILDANTGITAIDSAIKKLYTTGYIHNHERMWLASIICNIAGTNWQTGAKWMYHYLIDGDVASNMLSWQWVASSFSSKKYYANQENINKYSGFKQFGTFLDKSYEDLPDMELPQILEERQKLELPTELIIPEQYIYQSKVNENVILLNKNTINSNYIEPGYDYILHIDTDEQIKYPISQQRLDFIISMIDMELPECKILLSTSTKMKEVRADYGVKLSKSQERMFPTLTEYYPSFFKFWDKAEKLV
jgi:deoxyribodipyrimidine photo-lyase